MMDSFLDMVDHLVNRITNKTANIPKNTQSKTSLPTNVAIFFEDTKSFQSLEEAEAPQYCKLSYSFSK